MDKNSEYTSLRQEILDAINACDAYNIAMYTITITILGAAFTIGKPILFLLPYFVMFPFQTAINKKKDTTIRLGAYIAVFLEEGDGWESNAVSYHSIMNQWGTKPKFESVLNRIGGRISSVQLAVLSSGLCLISSSIRFFSEAYQGEKTGSIICFFMSWILMFLAWKHNQWTTKLSATKASYIDQLKKSRQRNN